ncbi:hypothetical protein ACLI4Z_18160 [Natrialbaceae archaeon A-arb3/5]|uniref:Uncharacterized protein n=1 Tax=Natronoglomus mannanivorans TaxID=2979990 RepID=A0AAP2YZU9_9EURY|nr:hypothetical protein [Halobacteria archaeon AArc-xg1-1]MCU4975896.1 hypothetical protein [Halobacteria archaeon AArc-m2/3/4]
MSLTRWLYFLWTFTVAGPLALMGVSRLTDGSYVNGAVFLVLAIVTIAVFEYIYAGLTN